MNFTDLLDKGWGILMVVLFFGGSIFVHELGHFLVAKYNNIGVIEFAIGFGKKIWSKQVGETTYSLRAIPLGGFVKMVGDDRSALPETISPAPRAASAWTVPVCPVRVGGGSATHTGPSSLWQPPVGWVLK